MKPGDIVIHKASNQQMVVLKYGSDWQSSRDVSCRFLNAITGDYRVGDFWDIEFEIAPKKN